MNVDDEVLRIIGGVTSGARRRNTTPWRYPRGYFPDPGEVLPVRCANCYRPLQRPREFIEKANARDGFVSCDSRCRKEQKAKGERFLLAGI